MAEDGESLESWLNKATNPSNRQEDWEYIMGFCDQINKELEGPQISVRLLAHKIQSPQEWEAVQALTVLEACMKNCGQRFHSEVGKFRFLNELIKVVSHKYLGDKVSERVKAKVIEMLYSWTLSIPDESKICEAYQMLKSQGVVLVDPEICIDAALIPSSSPRPKNPVFDDEKKSKRLSELLKSKKPEDLKEANRLIKNMVKEDEVRTRKTEKQRSTLEAAGNSVRLLDEMLAHFSAEHSSDGDKELIRELYSDCDKLRHTVSQLATETEDDDCNLGDMLQASDDLSHVITSYEKIVEGRSLNGVTGGTPQTRTLSKQDNSRTNQSEILIDLMGVDTQSAPVSQQQPPPSSCSLPADLLCASGPTAPECTTSQSAPSTALSLLDEELLSLGLMDPTPTESTHVNPSNQLPPSFQDLDQNLDIFHTNSPAVPASSTSASLLFPDALSVTEGSVVQNKFSASASASASAISYPSPVFSAPPLPTESVSTSSAIFPQSLSSVSAPGAPDVAPPQFFSMASAQSAAPLFDTQHLSIVSGTSNSPSASLNLQDLALLDLGLSPKNTPAVMDFGGLLVKHEDVAAPVSLSVSSTTSAQPLIGGIQAGSGPPPSNTRPDDSPLLRSLSPALPLSQASPGRGQDTSLANVFVPLESIKPSKACPVTAYDKNGVRVLLHFATDCPPGRADVLVMVASMLNTAPLPVRNMALQAAVPKTMKVRLQPPSGTELLPFNPILPPAAITQVVLLANPLKEKVRMRYKLIFTLGEQQHTEVGEVNEFPPVDRWGAL